MADEDGFTLAETLVAAAMMVTVLFAAYAIFDMTVRVLDLGGERLEASANARLGLERMAREIRAAYPNGDGGLAIAGDEDSITFANRPGSGPAEEITYDLSGGSRSYLRRDGQRVAGPLSGPEGLRFAYCESESVCSSAPDAGSRISLVRVTIEARVPGSSDATRSLTTEVFLRNSEASP